MSKCGRAFFRRFLGRTARILLPVVVATFPVPSIASPAPDFKIELLDGSVVQSRALNGKVIVLNFWASWCAPCKRELRELDAAFVRFGPSRLAVFAIDAEHGADRRRLAQQAAVMAIPVATAISGSYRPRNNAVPTTFVIDRAGRLVLTQAGALKPGAITALIDTLLAATSADDTRH